MLKNKLQVIMGDRQTGRSIELRQAVCSQIYENRENDISVLTVSFKQFMFCLMKEFSSDVLAHIMKTNSGMISYENITLEDVKSEAYISTIVEKVINHFTSDIKKVILVVVDDFPYDSNDCIDYIGLLSTFLNMNLNVDVIISKLNKDNHPANIEP